MANIDFMADDIIEFLFGFAAMIFAGYPMIKDIVNHEPNAEVSAVGTILFAVGITIGFLAILKSARNKTS